MHSVVWLFFHEFQLMLEQSLESSPSFKVPVIGTAYFSSRKDSSKNDKEGEYQREGIWLCLQSKTFRTLVIDEVQITQMQT